MPACVRPARKPCQRKKLMRLDRFISNLPRFNRQAARLLLASGRLQVDHQVVRDGCLQVREFHCIQLDGEVLQAGKAARFYLLHKPRGYVSATQHLQHPTVLDLLDVADKDELHLAGRLDLNTSGLLLLTNDGHWSRQLTLPASHLAKTYLVTTAQPITREYVELFSHGMQLANETRATLPAGLELLDSHSARLTLYEGRHHQIKRMFAHFHNKVMSLHRERIGNLTLDDLPCGHWRPLTVQELATLHQSQ